ncbi:retrovirus-related pol polyprotein from transposon TNT 1-94 [Tanacetum coccineum]
MSSECNNIKLAIRNDKYEVLCAMCKQCLITANHDVCVQNYVNNMNSHVSKERLALPTSSKPRYCLRWSPTGKMFDIKGNLIASSESNGDNAYLEVAFKRNTCFVINLEGVDLFKRNRTTNLYTANLHDMASVSPICLMARATSTKSWLWHQRLFHLNFDTINDLARNDLVIGLLNFKYHKEHLCPSCEQGKSKRESHPSKLVPNSKQRTKKIIETMNVTFDELSAMVFEQSSLKPELQSELDLLIEAMYDDSIGGQPLAAPRTVSAAQASQVL